MLRRNVTVAYGTSNVDRALAGAAESAARGKPTIVVGIVRKPNAKCWWVCLARQWTDITWVSAHRLRKQAEAQIALVERAAQKGRLDDDGGFAELIQELAANGDDDLQRTLPPTKDLSVRPGQEQALTDLLRTVMEQELATSKQLRKSIARGRQRTGPEIQLETRSQ